MQEFLSLYAHYLTHGFGRDLYDLAVVAYKTVDLVLNVGKLRVHGGGKTLLVSGTYLPAVEPAQRLGQRLYRLKSAIAEVGLTEVVFVALVVVAAELAQQHGTPQFILTVNVFLEVNV